MTSTATCRQLLASSMVLCTSFLYGCKTGYTQALITMAKSADLLPFKITPEEISWIASVSFSGTLVSVIISFTLGHKVSRRLFLFSCTLTFTIAWLLILITSSVTVIIICLFFYGIAASMMLIIGFVYFGEIASPKNREVLGLMYSLAAAVGVQVEYPLSLFNSYRLLIIFPTVVSIISVILFTFMVESPYYLLSKGFKGKTVTNLCWLNAVSNPEEVTEDIQNMRHYIDEQNIENTQYWRLIFLPENMKLVTVMIVITAAARVNCSAIIWQYGETILDTKVNGQLFVNVYNSLCVVGIILSLITIKKFERRALLLYGFLAGGIIQFLCAFCFYINDKNGNQTPFLGEVIAFLLIIFLMIHILTNAPALSILKSEIFPHNLKEFYTSLLSFTGDTVAFITVKSYLPLQSSVGIHFILGLYACFCIVGFIMVHIFVKDTKGKTLCQIRTELTSVTAKNEDKRGKITLYRNHQEKTKALLVEET